MLAAPVPNIAWRRSVLASERRSVTVLRIAVGRSARPVAFFRLSLLRRWRGRMPGCPQRFLARAGRLRAVSNSGGAGAGALQLKRRRAAASNRSPPLGPQGRHVRPASRVASTPRRLRDPALLARAVNQAGQLKPPLLPVADPGLLARAVNQAGQLKPRLLPVADPGLLARAVNQAGQLKPRLLPVADPGLLARAVNQAGQLKPPLLPVADPALLARAVNQAGQPKPSLLPVADPGLLARAVNQAGQLKATPAAGGRPRPARQGGESGWAATVRVSFPVSFTALASRAGSRTFGRCRVSFPVSFTALASPRGVCAILARAALSGHEQPHLMWHASS